MSQGRFKLSQQVKGRAREDSGCVVDCAEMKVSLMCWYGMCCWKFRSKCRKCRSEGRRLRSGPFQAAWLLTRVTVPETKGRSLEDWKMLSKRGWVLACLGFCTFSADFFPFWFLSVSEAIVLACQPKKSSLSKLRLHHRSALHEALIFWYDHRRNSILQEIQEEAFQGRLFRLKCETCPLTRPVVQETVWVEGTKKKKPVLQFCKKGTSRERSR